MALFNRVSRKPARPTTPGVATHQQTVAGFPVEVHTPPLAVDARLTGGLGRGAFAVLPRARSGPEVAVPAVAAGLLGVVDRDGHEIPTGDPAFDARYRVGGGDPGSVLPRLTDPLRALLLDHDLVYLVVHSGGACVSVAHGDPAGGPAAEQAALRVLELLVPA